MQAVGNETAQTLKLDRAEAATNTVDLRVAVKAPDLFPIREGSASQVAATNSYVLAQVMRGGEATLVLFNEANRELPVPASVLANLARGKITPEQLQEYGRRKGVPELAIDGSGGPGIVPFREFCEDFQLSQQEAERFRVAVLDRSTQGRLKLDGSPVLNGPFLRDFRLHTDFEERHFLLESGSAVSLIRTVDADNRPTPPEEWQVVAFADSSAIKESEMMEHPALDYSRISAKGRVLRGLNVALNHSQGTLTIVDTAQGKRILSESANCYALDPTRKGNVLFIGPDNHLNEVDVLQNRRRAITFSSRPLPFEASATVMKTDPHGNFIGVIASQSEQRTLYLLERDTLRVAAKIEKVGCSFDFNRFGEIYFTDAEGRVRLATTNLDSFNPDGLGEARELQKMRLSALLQHAKLAELPNVPSEKMKVDSEPQPEARDLRETVLTQVRAELGSKFAPMVEAATSAEEIERLTRQIEILRIGDRFREYPEVFDEIEEALATKQDGIETERLETQMREFGQVIAGKLTTRDLAHVHDSWAAITRARMNTVVRNEAVRQSVDRTYEELRNIIEKKLASLEKQVQKHLAETFPKIERIVQETIYRKDLHALRANQEFLDFEGAVSSLGVADTRQEWRKRYHNLFQEQERKVTRLEAQHDTEKMTRLAETLEDLKSIFTSIGEEVTGITHSTELVRWRKRNPLVLRYRALALGLSSDLRTRHENDLDQLVERRRRELLQLEQSNLMRTSDQVQFGTESFPVAPEARLIYRPVVKPVPGKTDTGALVFRDATGREFATSWGPVPFDIDHDETQRAIEANKAQAEEFFNSLKPKVPLYNPRWIMNDWSRGILEQMAQACREQLEIGSGIVILEGEAGCGKDVLWKMFAHFTQRGLELIPCNAQTEKEDILFDFDYTPEKGTNRVPSKFLETVQIPYTMALLGEINTAPPGVVKMLNSAMDEQRIIPVTRGVPIEMDPTVLLTGTMNPQHYIATQKLSQEVVSRATVIQVSYPPFDRGGGNGYHPYEAEMYAKYIPALKDASQEEFYQMWETVVNKDRSSAGDRYLTDERRTLIQHLFRVVKVANEIRSDYIKYHGGDPEAPKCEFIFTLREGVKIASRLKPDSKVSEVAKRVIMPKVTDPEEKLRVEAIITKS